jgi:hypothetical protein
MTEAEWLASSDPVPMLAYLLERENRRGRHLSIRRRRLFCCAFLRRFWPHLCHDFSRQAVAVAEELADGSRFDEEVSEALASARCVVKTLITQHDYRERLWAAQRAVGILESDLGLSALGWFLHDSSGGSSLAREVFGNPFSPPLFDPDWRTADVRALSAAAYEERLLPSGHLDSIRLSVLADALEDAGCRDVDLLSHLRSPGPHVRGCWALDLVLGKS